MIFLTLEYLRRRLDRFIHSEYPDDKDESDPYIILGEPALIDELGTRDKYQDKIIMCLLFTEEELALKNSSPYVIKEGRINIVNPPVFLNLVVIFCTNYNEYGDGLIKISDVAKFFQSNKQFKFSNSPVEENDSFMLTSKEKVELEMTIDMMTLSIEQVNHLWGTLKSRVLPFLVYKVRVVKLETEQKLQEGEIIKEMEIGLK